MGKLGRMGPKYTAHFVCFYAPYALLRLSYGLTRDNRDRKATMPTTTKPPKHAHLHAKGVLLVYVVGLVGFRWGLRVVYEKNGALK